MAKQFEFFSPESLTLVYSGRKVSPKNNEVRDSYQRDNLIFLESWNEGMSFALNSVEFKRRPERALMS